MPSGNSMRLCQSVPKADTGIVDLDGVSARLTGLHYCYGGGDNVSGAILRLDRGGDGVEVFVKHLGTVLAEALYHDEDRSKIAALVVAQSVDVSPEQIYKYLSGHYAGDEAASRSLVIAVAELVARSCR